MTGVVEIPYSEKPFLCLRDVMPAFFVVCNG